MTIQLPKLPYEKNALEPHISSETLEYHYGKHHRVYVTNINNMISGTPLEGKNLEYIISNSKGGVFNNAAQVWNHSFYWNCLSPNGGGTPNEKLLNKINEAFGSFEEFKKNFSAAAIGNFGSGWTWLVGTPAGKLEIVSTDDADTVLNSDNTPLLVIDVWEHAYYIDYRNARPNYVEAFWNLVNWEFVEGNLG